jgi:hypothetical protein
MTEDANKTSNLWKDSYLAYIPLLGAALALTFDVGYFFALNLSFFTLFSLSEHILFAIQSFPIAVAVLLICLIAIGVFLNTPFLWNRPPPAAPGPHQLYGVQLILAIVIFAILFLAPLLVFILYLLYSTPIITPLAIEIFVVLGGWVFINDPYKRTFTAAATVLFLLTFSFYIGYLFAASATAKADPNNIFQLEIGTINLKTGAPITGRIIRSGERGVLIYDPASDRLRFLSWEGISSIEAPPPKPPR